MRPGFFLSRSTDFQNLHRCQEGMKSSEQRTRVIMKCSGKYSKCAT